MDIQKIVVEQFAVLKERGLVEELTQKHLSTMLNSLIGDLFSYSSPFRKSLEEALKEQLKLDFSQLGLMEYGQQITQMMRTSLNNELTIKGLGKIKEDMQELLKTNAPQNIKLSELIERFVESLRDRPSTISFFCEEGITGRSYWVHFDKKENVKKHQCEYKLLLNGNGTIAIAEWDGRKLNEGLNLGGLFGFEAILFRMYAMGTIIENDADDVRTVWYDD